MNINEFLTELVDDDCELRNIFLKEDKEDFIYLMRNVKSKLAIALSSQFFNEHVSLLSEIQNVNYIESIISLPIFHDSANVILITFNSNNESNEFVLIDESDSLIHHNSDENWFYIEDDLANELINSIENYQSSDNALSLNINKIIDEDSKDSLEEDVYTDFLSIKNSKAKKPKLKRKIIHDDLVNDFLDLKEKELLKQKIVIKDIPINDFSVNFINELMYDKKRQNPENLLYRDDKPLIDGEVIFRKLGKISDLRNINEKNDKNSILIATCKHCALEMVNYNHDVEDFNNEIYVEIDNVSEDVLIDYLYEYLNSNNGKDELRYYSKGYNYIRAELIKSVKIPIPPIDVQKEIVKASRDAREFFKTVELLKNQFYGNIFDYKHVIDSINELQGDIEFDSQTNEITKLSRSWRHAYQGLIWPLAISYLSATKGGFETVEKKDNYLRLFEFIAAFNSIILLSGLPDEVYQKNFNVIWDANSLNLYKEMTFTKWVIVSQNLAKVYRNNNFTSKLDEELFEKITSDRILEILNIAKEFRNDQSHGPQSNVYEAGEIVDILDGYLDDIFDILEVYSNYKLIYITGDYSGSQEGYSHRVILLNGPCAQPIYDKLSFDNILLKESLYLYNPRNNKKLEIKNNMMKFKAIDDYKKRWALFVYYKCDKDEFNAYYKCFQSNEKDLKISINSFKHDILN